MMYHRINHRLVVVFGISFFIFANFAMEPAVISTEEFPPFTSANLKGNGIDCDIVREAFKQSGIEVKFVFVPAARSLKMAEEGETDATLPWAKRPGREDNFLFSDPVIAQDNEVFFFLRGNTFDWDTASRDYGRIKGKTIGAVISYNYGLAFENAARDGVIKVERVTSDKLNFEKLFAKRFDALIAKRMVGQFILKSAYTGEQRSAVAQVAENTGSKDSDYLLISRKSPRAAKLLESINSGLREIRQNGQYDRMMKAFEKGTYFEPMRDAQRPVEKENEH